MSKKRYFDTKFWSDIWIVDTLNPLDRYLFMYLMLNEKTNIAGVYELPLRTMANEVGLDKEEITRMLKRLEPKVFYRDGYVVLINAIKHQNYKNKFIAEGIKTELCKAPPHLLELVHIPEDMDYDLTCDVQDSSRTPQDSRVIESNLIELNRIKSNASKAADVSKKPSKSQIAKSQKADAAIKQKEQEAKTRSTSNGYQTFASAGELLKKHKLK